MIKISNLANNIKQTVVKGLWPLSILLTLFYYILIIKSASTTIGDDYIFRGIEIETTIVFIIFLLIIFTSDLAQHVNVILFFYILLIAIIPILPIIKYPNPLHIAGIGDSVAHYSFAKYITTFQRIPIEGEVYYSLTYGWHPGCGIINSFINLISTLDLGVAMVISLIGGYISYAIIVYKLIIMHLPHSMKLNHRRLNIESLKMLLFLFVARYPPTYTGLHASWIYGAMLMYLLFKMLKFNKSISTNTVLFILYICCIGLMLTHLSSFIINIIYILLTFVITYIVYKKKIHEKALWILVSIILTYISYQTFIDFILFRSSVNMFRFFDKFYVEELRIASRTLTYYNMSLFDLVRFFIGTYTEVFITLIFFTIQLVLFLICEIKLRYSKLNFNIIELTHIRLIIVSQIFLLLPIMINAIVLRELITSFWRSIPILQVNIIISLAQLTYLFSITNKTKKLKIDKIKNRYFVIRSVEIIAIISIIFLLFTTNFAHGYINPQITYKDEKYTIKTDYCLSYFLLDSLIYLKNYYDVGSIYYFVSIDPYISFSLADLLWNVKKIPTHGSISTTTPEDVMQIINSYDKGIYLLPLSDLIIGKIGQKSYYMLPFRLLLGNSSIIYNNGYITLFIKN